MIKILVLSFLIFSSLSYAEENDEDCYTYQSFGDAYPLAKDKIKMIEELNEAIKDINSPKGSYDKKVKFFQSIIPDVVEALNAVEQERAQLMSILANPSPSEKELKQLEDLKVKYSTKSTDTLKRRINIIPIDLILVQSAIESGWGSSNAAKNCNNLMGIHAYGGLSICNTPSKKIASFSSKRKSLDAYILSINKNGAYKGFRKKREELLKQKQKFSGLDLAPFLLKYSTRGKSYTDEVKQYIKNHKLDDVIANAIQISETCEFSSPAN